MIILRTLPIILLLFATINVVSAQEVTRIGVTLQKDRLTALINIEKILKDGPAYNAGMQVGDQVIAVDGQMVEFLRIDQVVSRIRGKAGDMVKLWVDRNGESLEFQVIREKYISEYFKEKMRELNNN